MSLNQLSRHDPVHLLLHFVLHIVFIYRLIIFPVLGSLQCITLIFLYVFWYDQLEGSSSDSV